MNISPIYCDVYLFNTKYIGLYFFMHLHYEVCIFTCSADPSSITLKTSPEQELHVTFLHLLQDQNTLEFLYQFIGFILVCLLCQWFNENLLWLSG